MRLKRVISAALAVSMAVSMMPATAVSAFAEGTSTKTAETTTVTGKDSTESKAETSGDCGVEGHEEVKWAYDESTKVLTISGNGPMADYNGIADTDVGTDNDLRPWKPYLNQITEVHIEEGVTAIGNSAFRGMKALKKANIPASIQHLGDYIFRYDEALEEVIWAEGFEVAETTDVDSNQNANQNVYTGKYLPTSMFDYCYELGKGKELTKWLPKSFEGVGCAAVRGTQFTVDFDNWSNLKYIGAYAFSEMPNLESFTLTNNIQIGMRKNASNAFQGSGLKELIVNTEEVPKNFASGCTKLNTLVLGSGVEEVPDSAFAGSAITELDVPASVKKIENWAFIDCKALKKVTIHGETVLNTVPFAGCDIKEFVIENGAKVTCTDNPFRSSGSYSAVTTLESVKIIGTLERSADNKNCTTTEGLWKKMFSPSEQLKEVTVSDANQPYVKAETFPKMENLKVVGDDATFTASLAGCTNLKTVDLTGCKKIASYAAGCFGDGMNDSTVIYVNDASAIPGSDTGISNRHGIVMVVKGGTVNTDKTGFDSVTKAGCTAKWYEDAKCQTETEDITPVKGKTYYAKWTKNNYTVTFNNNGHDEKPADKSVEYGDSVTDLPELSDSTSEWVFDGWYMDENFKTKYDNQAITDNTTLYAKWHEYKSADLTVTVANSEYLVNEPVEVNVVAALGDDSGKVAKVVLEYDDDVTSVKLGDITLGKKEFTSMDIYQLLQQVGSKDDAKLTVTYSKPGKHTFSVALVDKDGKNVCEAGTDITVVQALMDTTVTEDGEQKETYPANKPITVKMNVTADKETFKQNTLYLTYGDEVEKVELNGHKLTEKQYKISDLLDMMETSPVAVYALRSEADALSIPFEVTFKDAGSYNFEMLVKDAQDQLVCRSIVPITVEAEKKPDDTKDNTDTKPATYTLSILGGTVKVNGKETAVDEHGDIAIAKDAKVEVTFDKGILSDAQTFDQWIIKPNSVLNAVDPKSETIVFTMPDEKVTIEAMTKDASIEDEPNILGTAAVVGTAAVGTAILAWQGYQLGTELYLKTALPAGTAIPTNRAELALLVWNHAGKPAPAAVLPADTTDTQKAIAWAVENDLLKVAKDNGETYVDTDSVSRVEVIRVWNKAQEK